MDYTLQSLNDAFTDAAYKASRTGYKLYAVLLATTLDQRFLAEYLSLFEELHALTGDDVLVVGVKSGGYQPDPPNDEPLVRTFQLRSVAKILRHGDFETEDRLKDGHTWAERFLRFLRMQTDESYALAHFLGVRTDQFPAMVFFEDLERPSEMVVWQLRDMRGSDFTRELRYILEEARGRCAWRDVDSAARLRRTIESLQDKEPSEFDRNVPDDFRDAAKALRGLRHDLEPHQRAIGVYEKIDELRAAFDEVRAIAGLRVPLDGVGQTLERLATGAEVHRGYAHVIAHERRWRTRLPTNYRSAVAALKSEPRPSGVAKNLPPRDVAAANAATISAELARVEEAHEVRRQFELDRRLRELDIVQARIQAAPSTLSVVEEILHVRSQSLEAIGSPPEALRTMRGGKTPRVFISYSHDSASHAATVLDLAQRLRGDGVDCWIDQFESSPAAGFPRWMQQQIGAADYVLLICTRTYCTRFNGVEQAGKGLGATFEGHLILQELYDSGARNDRFVPILFPGGTSHDVPAVLRGSKWYELPDSYELLRRRLLASDAVTPVVVGATP
jgi:hypothetical protein